MYCSQNKYIKIIVCVFELLYIKVENRSTQKKQIQKLPHDMNLHCDQTLRDLCFSFFMPSLRCFGTSFQSLAELLCQCYIRPHQSRAHGTSVSCPSSSLSHLHLISAHSLCCTHSQTHTDTPLTHNPCRFSHTQHIKHVSIHGA